MAEFRYGNNLWESAINKVLNVFQVASLYKEQEEALTQLFSKRDVFVNLPTSYEKSLIFQAASILVMFSFEEALEPA